MNTYYAKGSFFDATQLMPGDIVQVAQFTQKPSEANTFVVDEVCAEQGTDECLVSWTNGEITAFDTGNRKCWVVGDTLTRDDDDAEAWEPSENVGRIVVDAKGAPLGMVGPGPSFAIVPIDDKCRATEGALEYSADTVHEHMEADAGPEEVEDFGEPRKTPHVECEDFSERSRALQLGKLGGATFASPEIHTFGWDVTSTPKAPRDEYPNTMRKCRQAIDANARFLALVKVAR